MEHLKSTLANGFKRCGLYPFDPNSVDYSSLTSGNIVATDPSPPLPKLPPSAKTDSLQESAIDQLESYLSPPQLKCFKQNLTTRNWTGPIEDTSLFAVWKRMRNNTNALENPESVVETVTTAQLSEDEEPQFLGFPDSQANDADVKDQNCRNKLKNTQTTTDVLTEAFPKPRATQIFKPKKNKIRPPAVATGKAYKEFIEKVEKQKQEEELTKKKKKIEKQLKKAEKEKNVLKKKFDQFLQRRTY
ncbi:uncharacterized protein LOC110675391 [Aedes aegypti]|uniref:Uncharacterized protein n=1 Tax=Aedes aegypti TaxID=7159 RepID=A0A6I8U6I6_AEDAE|nr:uncharacterized protein LOC110675391 [Aedes aegypti]